MSDKNLCYYGSLICIPVEETGEKQINIRENVVSGDKCSEGKASSREEICSDGE